MHSAVDFDMSFFYIKLIAFTLLGILSSYSKNNKLVNCKILQIVTEVIILAALFANSYGNISLKIAKNLSNDKKKIYNFELANKLAPYSLDVKKDELGYLEPSQKDIKRQIEIYQEIIKNEKAYDKVQAYKRISRSAQIQLKKGKINEAEKILKQATEILKQRENRFPKQISNYRGDIYTILHNINRDEIKEFSENKEVKEYIQESIKQALKMINEAEQNITDYKVTQMTKEYYETEMKRLNGCKITLLEMEKEM